MLVNFCDFIFDIRVYLYGKQSYKRVKVQKCVVVVDPVGHGVAAGKNVQ